MVAAEVGMKGGTLNERKQANDPIELLSPGHDSVSSEPCMVFFVCRNSASSESFLIGVISVDLHVDHRVFYLLQSKLVE